MNQLYAQPGYAGGCDAGYGSTCGPTYGYAGTPWYARGCSAGDGAGFRIGYGRASGAGRDVTTMSYADKRQRVPQKWRVRQ